jgi:predicted AAA+ superfamily ATPase
MDLLKTKFAIENKQVIYYDFSDPLLDDVNYKLLYEEILNKSQPNDINYIFLDEIQEVKNFEKCVIGLFENKTFRFDIYLTGSNSKMLSSELATLFTGRYQEIKIYPLSFSEYLLVVSNILQKFDKHDLFNQYLLYGGLPGIIEVIKDTTLIQKKVNKVIDDVINKDIKKRHKLRITNAPEFDRICKFLFENIGGVISIENIEKYLKSNNKSRISANTIDRYLAWLCEALLIYRVNY